MTSFTPFYVGGICKQCNTGEMYQYQEDPTGILRCGLCGELALEDEDEPSTDPRQEPTEDTPYPDGAVIQVPAKKRAYNRKKVA